MHNIAARAFVVLVASLWLVACTSVSKYTHLPEAFYFEDALRERAAFEFPCDPGALELTRLGNGGTVGVSGCGHKAVYVAVNGRWVVNSLDGSAASK